MYATAVFGFEQSDSGWLMSEFAFIRAVFLIFLFPPIINNGRRWYLARERQKAGRRETEGCEPTRLATNPEELEAPVGSLTEEEPVASAEVKEDEGTAFDLFFLRISLVVDGILTMCAAFATKGWHIYLGMLDFRFLRSSTRFLSIRSACNTILLCTLTFHSCLLAPLRLRIGTGRQGRHDRDVLDVKESRRTECLDAR